MYKNAKILPLFERKFYTVSEITSKIKELIENEFFDIWIVGEVSNLSTPISGHSYFTLKDNFSSIRCVLFKSQKKLLKLNIKNGEEILIRGRLSVYEVRGEYQIIVDYMEPYGKGKLFIEIEKLKQKLKTEGLFDDKYKKNIPKYPAKIGIITSITGAAIRDILNIIKRRFSGIQIYIYPVKVQGDTSAKLITEGINFLNKNFDDLDVIIIARGGGTIEDLMPFNNETVARAIFASNIPIISAIGHETDWTIADFVADLRAPTPSAAAELVVKNSEELVLHIDNLLKRLLAATINNFQNYKFKLTNYEKILQSYYYNLEDVIRKFKLIENNLPELLLKICNKQKEKLNYILYKLFSLTPETKIKLLKQVIENNNEKLIYLYKSYIKTKKDRFRNLCDKLNILSPLNILGRGYSIVFKNKQIVKTSEMVKDGDKILIKTAKGDFNALVIQKQG